MICDVRSMMYDFLPPAQKRKEYRQVLHHTSRGHTVFEMIK